MKSNLTPMPTSSKPKTMNFPDAIREIINGKKVTRVSWGNKDYCFLKGEWLTIFTKGNFHTWLINDGDLLAEDWIVVESEIN